MYNPGEGGTETELIMRDQGDGLGERDVPAHQGIKRKGESIAPEGGGGDGGGRKGILRVTGREGAVLLLLLRVVVLLLLLRVLLLRHVVAHGAAHREAVDVEFGEDGELEGGGEGVGFGGVGAHEGGGVDVGLHEGRGGVGGRGGAEGGLQGVGLLLRELLRVLLLAEGEGGGEGGDGGDGEGGGECGDAEGGGEGFGARVRAPALGGSHDRLLLYVFQHVSVAQFHFVGGVVWEVLLADGAA